ncbi:MAG: tRNA dihydrouridine(20/20a) synthase DusA, partial [Lysobacterales bacterium]
RFGACLMREPELVGDCVAAMRAAVNIPVTVKCRIGVDQQDQYADLHRFVATVRAAGCSVFIVHARKAWLSGLSPKENRDVPPLNYARVFALKHEFADLTLVLNGGLDRVDSVRAALTEVDGAMLGRAAYHDPWLLAELQRALFGAGPDARAAVLADMRDYTERHLAEGGQLAQITRHLLGLYQGRPGARQFRRILSERAHRAGAGWEVVAMAMAAVEAERRAA